MDVVECQRCGRSRPAHGGAALGASCPYCLLMFAFGDAADGSANDTEAGGAADRMPERIGPYLVLELLGAGGMGTVYRARHEGLGREVALKVLRPEFARQAGFRERFQREGRVLASLSHPHIVGIHDTGCDDGLYYLAMEYVAGSTLRAKLNEGKLSPDVAIKIFGELCEALQYAHERGIIHRDIKPENVLLDADGRAKIADFGVAKLMDADEAARAPATEINTVVGTRRYMAPEQLELGRPINQRADLYALAAVLYEMLTRESPLGVFAPPSVWAKSDPRLDDPIMRALANDPKARPADARKFADDVRRAIGEPTTTGWLMRRRRLLALGAVAVVAAGAVVARRLTVAKKSIDPLAELGARRLVHPAGVWRSVYAPDGLTLVTACGDRMVRLWNIARGEQVAAFPAYPRGELGYLSLAASPDGLSLATAGGENVARIWNLKSAGERFTLVGHNREIVDVAWSPDGALIATAAHDKSVRLWNAADGTAAGVFDALPDPALSVAFSPDGKLLAAGVMNGAIEVWDVATRTLRHTLGHQKRVWSLAFAAGNKPRLVSGSHDQTLKIWTFEPDGMARKSPPAAELRAGGEVWSVAVSPHGNLLAAGLNDGTLILRSFPEGKPVQTVKQHTASIVDVSFSPDGAHFATSSLDGSAIVWSVSELIG